MCGYHAAVQLEPPKAAPPPGQRSGGFCQLVRVVRRFFMKVIFEELRLRLSTRARLPTQSRHL
jgi:hypothetical protein